MSIAHRACLASVLLALLLCSTPAALFAQTQIQAAEPGLPPARDDTPDWQTRLELARLLTSVPITPATVNWPLPRYARTAPCARPT